MKATPRSDKPDVPVLDKAEMERAFMERDGSYDGLFYAAVTTTGIFCRPSCPARKAKPEHLEYFSSAREALFAGFRPCARCRPLDGPGGAVPPPYAAPAWVCKLVDRVESDPSRRIRDAELSAEGIDPATARRWFLRNYGMTFQAYSRARRLGEAFRSIKDGSGIDDAVFDHGWESHSAFRDAFSRAAGLPPGAAKGEDFVRLAWLDSPLGPMVAGATDTAICLLEFTDRRMMEAQLRTLSSRLGKPLLPGDSPLIARLRSQLSEYFEGRRSTFNLPLDYPGTDFQRRVWEGLLHIPYGETRSYAQLAAEIGATGAERAVGTANGMNRIAILIPCHRVITTDGSLGGYGGGLWRKLRLLEREGSANRLRPPRS
ncbi:MAG: methylated-DNA--[protein]-cysteine S-methyltransferase [Spirochaetales bacterium]|nr:methylated-DNA--[protein]-cysteine S-methyltransferase [Spirochaetales bacterium]